MTIYFNFISQLVRTGVIIKSNPQYNAVLASIGYQSNIIGYSAFPPVFIKNKLHVIFTEIINDTFRCKYINCIDYNDNITTVTTNNQLYTINNILKAKRYYVHKLYNIHITKR